MKKLIAGLLLIIISAGLFFYGIAYTEYTSTASGAGQSAQTAADSQAAADDPEANTPAQKKTFSVDSEKLRRMRGLKQKERENARDEALAAAQAAASGEN